MIGALATYTELIRSPLVKRRLPIPPRTEAALAGGATIAEVQAVLVDEVQPIDDLRSTAAYRRRVSANLLAQFWSETPRGGRS